MLSTWKSQSVVSGLSAPRVFAAVRALSSHSIRKAATMAQQRTADDSVLKLATFRKHEGASSSVGIVRGKAIWPLEDVASTKSPNSDIHEVIKDWDSIKESIHLEGPGLELADIELQAPIPRPTGAIMCIGKNYRDHVKEMDKWKTAPDLSTPDAPKSPIVFTKAPQSVIGPGAAIKYPHGLSSQVDYEAELAVIIGKPGRGIKKENAFEHVFGYTILNDVTARDLQKRHQQWFIGKSCDTFCPMGPWIVPATEVDGQNLQIQCWINDELRQDGRTSDMIFSIADLIETLSACITLQPGDIIATGTPSGVGSGFHPPKHLLPGDKIRMKIENIGELHNFVSS